MEPISAGIVAGGSILSGLISSYFTSAAAEQATQAAQRAQDQNYQLAMKESEKEDKRFNIQHAMENMKMKLFKENQAWTQKNAEEEKQANLALGFANRLSSMGDAGLARGQNLSGAWAAQKKL